MSNSNSSNTNNSSNNNSLKRSLPKEQGVGEKRRKLNDNEKLTHTVKIKKENGGFIQANELASVTDEKGQNEHKDDNAANKNNKNARMTAVEFAKISKWAQPGTFCVEVRVTHISELTSIQRTGRESQFFYAVLLDCKGKSMKINFWNNQAKAMHIALKLNGIYRVSHVKVHKPESKWAKYGALEFNCTKKTQFLALKESEVHILPQYYKFIGSIKKIADKKADTKLDVAGVVCNIEEPRFSTNKKTNKKQEVGGFVLADQSASIRVALFNEHVKVPLKEHAVIAIQSAKVSDYGEKSLVVAGHIVLNPNNARTEELKQWKQENENVFAETLSNLQCLTNGERKKNDYSNAPVKTVEEVNLLQETFRFSQIEPTEGNCFVVVAAIADLEPNIFYEKNGQNAYRLRLTLQDEQEENFKAVAWNEAAEKIVGLSVEEAEKLQQEQPEEFETKMEAVCQGGNQLTLHVCWRVNDYWKESKKLDFFIEDVQK